MLTVFTVFRSNKSPYFIWIIQTFDLQYYMCVSSQQI